MPLELHTDRLRKETGADRITCDVLHHDVEKRRRLVNIVSETAGQRSVHTTAYTFLLPHRWTDDITRIDRLLKAGNLMGETFRRKGYAVRQNRLLRVRLPLLSRKITSQFGCKPGQLGEIEVYEFWANDIIYGFIVEFKHPTHRKGPDRKSAGLHAVLRHLGFTHESLFRRLDNSTSGLNIKIIIARAAGILVGIGLYVRALRHIPQWIDAE